MKPKNDDLINSFEKMARWMIEDTERAMYKAKANFLVAQGLLNYTEIIGSFLLPNTNDSGEKFDVFLRRMGPEYSFLLRRFNGKRRSRPHIVYDDLRCGLTHEYVVKRKNFTVYNHDKDRSLTESEINNLKIDINGNLVKCSCGLLHTWEGSKGRWHIVDPKYWLDFKKALEQYLLEIKDKKNKNIRKNFFIRARKINFVSFN